MKDAEIRAQLLKSGAIKAPVKPLLHQLGKTERRRQQKKLQATLNKQQGRITHGLQ